MSHMLMYIMNIDHVTFDSDQTTVNCIHCVYYTVTIVTYYLLFTLFKYKLKTNFNKIFNFKDLKMEFF